MGMQLAKLNTTKQCVDPALPKHARPPQHLSWLMMRTTASLCQYRASVTAPLLWANTVRCRGFVLRLQQQRFGKVVEHQKI